MSAEDSNDFATTRWTRVHAARGDSEEARVALSELCAGYYGPVVKFLTCTGLATEDARELAHEFFANLLARGGVAGFHPGRGRFRSYLLGALKHFLATRRRREASGRRGGNVPHAPLDTQSESQRLPGNEEAGEGGDAVFDREWAVSIVEQALEAVKAGCTTADCLRQFEILKPWLSIAGDPGSQAEAARKLGVREGAVKVAVHRLRRRFRDEVRRAVADTLPDGDSPEAELEYLIRALGSVVDSPAPGSAAAQP